MSQLELGYRSTREEHCYEEEIQLLLAIMNEIIPLQFRNTLLIYAWKNRRNMLHKIGVSSAAHIFKIMLSFLLGADAGICVYWSFRGKLWYVFSQIRELQKVRVFSSPVQAGVDSKPFGLSLERDSISVFEDQNRKFLSMHGLLKQPKLSSTTRTGYQLLFNSCLNLVLLPLWLRYSDFSHWYTREQNYCFGLHQKWNKSCHVDIQVFPWIVRQKVLKQTSYSL